MGLKSCVGDLLDRRFFKKAKRTHDVEHLKKLFDQFADLCAARIKPSAPKDAKAQYSLGFSAGRTGGYRAPYKEVYWESQVGFVLESSVEEHTPFAFIGFRMGHDAIDVIQIQGIRGKKEALRSLHWELLLLDLVIEYARLHRLKRVYVLPARWNSYNPLYNDELSVRKGYSAELCRELDKRFRLIYDKNALKRGFKLNRDGTRFVLEL